MGHPVRTPVPDDPTGPAGEPGMESGYLGRTERLGAVGREEVGDVVDR